MGRELLKRRGVREAALAPARPTAPSGGAATARTQACRDGACRLNATGVKIVGVPVDTGVDASPCFGLGYSASRTASLYVGAIFDEREEPLASTTAAWLGHEVTPLAAFATPRSQPAL